MRYLCLLLCAVCLPALAVDGRVAAGGWGFHVSGFVNDNGERLDFQRDLGAKREDGLSFEAMIGELGPRWLPDLALSYTPIKARGGNSRQTGTSIGPIDLGGGTVTRDTDADLDDYDATLRYPFAFGPLRLTPGLAVKRLDGVITIVDRSDGSVSRQPFDETFPMLALRGTLDLGDNFALELNALGVQYQGDRAVDARAMFWLRLLQPVVLGAGWQLKRYEIDTGNYRLDARLDGARVLVGIEW